jgi:signal transduction histidine kinase
LLESSQLDARGREAAQIISGTSGLPLPLAWTVFRTRSFRPSDSSDHLLSLVNNILDYESVETHQLVMEHIPFSLSKETNKVVNLLAVLANQKDVRLEKDVLAHYDMHIGDPLRYLLRLLACRSQSPFHQFFSFSFPFLLKVPSGPVQPGLQRDQVHA